MNANKAPIEGVPRSADDIAPPEMEDRLLHAAMGRMTSNISPTSLALAYFDWALHLMESPGKQKKLVEKAARKSMRIAQYASQCGGPSAKQEAIEPCIKPLPQDKRFQDPAWQQWPYNLIYQGFLLNQQWWHNATTGIGGVSEHHEQVVSFVARQMLDMVSPMNFVATNPTLLKATMEQGGQNLMRGAKNFGEDWMRNVNGKTPRGADTFQLGVNVAATKGDVVHNNRLMELIQYAPTTKTVCSEPILIVPAWIMKYYILDLSSENSMVRYLVDQGHTVFMISWVNPAAEDRDLGMEDYLRMGVLEALKAIRTIIPERSVNTIGYCLGGTLLSIAAAYLAQSHRDVINSITLLAAQTDFTEAGELKLFVDDSQLNYLEDIMWKQGYLKSKQMAGAFQLLRSTDLVWSLILHDYLMGERTPMNDMMAWNADATRMPYRMHSEYLRRLFLNNDLFQGNYKAEGKVISLSDIHVPMFVLGTEKDHIAPWRSVYKINLVADTDVTFALTNGGHNAGIISEPGHKHRHFRIGEHCADMNYSDPETWFLAHEPIEGSWWPAWSQWLAQRCTSQVEPPRIGASDEGYPSHGPAPGTYVLKR
jgi:polyhydroxyalkanoate synthase